MIVLRIIEAAIVICTIILIVQIVKRIANRCDDVMAYSDIVLQLARKKRQRGILCCLALLVLLICTIGVTMQGGSKAGGWIKDRVNRLVPVWGTQRGPPRWPIIEYHAVGPPFDELRIYPTFEDVDDGVDSYDAASAYAREIGAREEVDVHVDRILVMSRPYKYGVWGTTRRWRFVRVGAFLHVPPHDMETWWDHILDTLSSHLQSFDSVWWEEYGPLLTDATSDGISPYERVGREEEYHLPGYIHNLITVLALAATVNFGWQWIGFRRAIKRVKKDHCANCSYDLRGDLDRGCPECGWNRPAERNAAPVHDRLQMPILP